MPQPIDFDALMTTFLADKRRKNPTGKTAETYRTAVVEFGHWLGELPATAKTTPRGKGKRALVTVPAAVDETGDITTDHIRCFITHLQTRDQQPGGRRGTVDRSGRKLSPGTVNNRYRAIQSFVKWLHLNGEFGDGGDNLGANPMAVLSPPDLVENPVDVLTLDQMRALIDTCGKGRRRDFLDIRDEAILRTCFEAGGRRTEVATALAAGLDLERKLLRVDGSRTKTNLGRDLPFGEKTRLVLSRYMISRSRHRLAERPELWLAQKGPLSTGGLYQMVRRRGRMIGIEGLHPHQFRHTFGNEFLNAGGSEADLKRIGGWQSDKMVARYTRAGADRRAQAAHSALALGDRI